MRNLYLLDIYRRTDPDIIEKFGSTGDHQNGMFQIKSDRDGAPIDVIASNGYGWEHVSCKRFDGCPDWQEMEQVKRLFFNDGETVMQLHVPPAKHINIHPNVLHLWRPVGVEIPRPPEEMI